MKKKLNDYTLGVNSHYLKYIKTTLGACALCIKSERANIMSSCSRIKTSEDNGTVECASAV